nr:deoxyribodipyrimidine photo-lyase [Candidatus Eremiobacteraeota bacterium]
MIRTTRYDCSIVWLRRDLRLSDNAALHQAAKHSARICMAFVLDPVLLRSERAGAPIVQFFFSALQALREDLLRRQSDLVLLEGASDRELMTLARSVNAQALFFNEDYEPGAVERDRCVERAFEQSGIAVHHFADHVYASASELLSDSGEPYRLFAPYKRRWLQQQRLSRKTPFPSQRLSAGQLLIGSELPRSQAVPKPEAYGHRSSADFPCGSEAGARAALTSFLRKGGPALRYAIDRNFPGRNGTSHLSPHLRAGTIGIRTCIAAAAQAAGEGDERTDMDVWLSELIWRDFYQQILRNFPHVVSEPFRSVVGLQLRNCDAEFAAWCTARTGYPIVDAA